MSRCRTSQSSISMPTGSKMTNEVKAYPFSKSQRSSRGPIEGPGGRRLVRRITWRSSSYKFMASLWVFGVLYLVWLIRDMFYFPFSWCCPSSSANDYFARFEGRQECGISSRSLYAPERDHKRASSKLPCQNRASLLNAMSNGGRIGFDASYSSRDCSYRWYTTSQTCNILQKFDGIAFVGDQSLSNVYAGFNILLRQNLAFGSLRDWEMTPQEIDNCTCSSQFSNGFCMPHRISSSYEVDSLHDRMGARNHHAYPIDTPHIFIALDNSSTEREVYIKFLKRVSASVPKKETNQRKIRIPVIHSLSHSATSFSAKKASSSMKEWSSLTTRTSGDDTPFLWVGPTAPGRARRSDTTTTKSSDNSVWQYSSDTAEAARNMDMDFLGMYNATLHMESFDGLYYGEEASLLQAMMIVNWLSTL